VTQPLELKDTSAFAATDNAAEALRARPDVRGWSRPPYMALAAFALAGLVGGTANRPVAVVAELTGDPSVLEPVALLELRPIATPPIALQAPALTLPDSRVPASSAIGSIQIGDATYFANMLEGRPTASGEPLDQQEPVAAHRDHPFGTWLKVTNPTNGRSVLVRVIDRGPFAVPGRETAVIDLSRAAAAQIGLIQRGRAKVKIEVVPAPAGRAERSDGRPRG
jgi:rare lipoprotein A